MPFVFLVKPVRASCNVTPELGFASPAVNGGALVRWGNSGRASWRRRNPWGISEGSLEGASGHCFRLRHRCVKVGRAEVLSSSQNILPQSHLTDKAADSPGPSQAGHILSHPGHAPAQEPPMAPQGPHVFISGSLHCNNHSLSLGL